MYIVITILVIILILALISIVWSKANEYEKLKYEFITIIAHKFRTPLSQTKWLLEGIKESEQDPYKLENFKNLEQSNNKLIDLTNTLIELTESNKESLTPYKFERVNICELTKSIVDNVKTDFHERNLFLGIQCDSPDIFAEIDTTRLEFAIQTILENSINYSPIGRNVDISIYQKKKKIFIAVKDNGIGIDKAGMSRIFTKFYRSDKARKMDPDGFGVGLFLAQEIVKRHRGKISAYSEGLDKGSTFVISLPSVK